MGRRLSGMNCRPYLFPFYQSTSQHAAYQNRPRWRLVLFHPPIILLLSMMGIGDEGVPEFISMLSLLAGHHLEPKG